MDTLLQFTTSGIVFLLTLVLGVWLSHSGKPYHSILFNIHKLVALGGVIVTIIQISAILKNDELQVLMIVLLGLASLCVVALFASGALLSANKLDFNRLLTIHRIAPIVLAIVMVLVVYWLGLK